MSAVAAKGRGILPAAIGAGELLMDIFGLGLLVDKIGERFGNRVRDALLLLVAVAAFVVSLNVIVTYGVIPVIAFVRGVGTKSVLNLLESLLVAGLIGAASGLVLQFVVRLLLRRIMANAESASARASELLDEVKAALEDARIRSREYMSQADAKIDEAEKRADELLAREKEMERLSAELLKLIETTRDEADKKEGS